MTKLSQHGDFDPSLVERARDAMTYRFSKVDEYSFATCERPDGSRYGTSGQCRKGTETTAEDRKSSSKVRTAGDIFLDLQKLGKGPSAQKEALLKEYFAAVGTAPAPPKAKAKPKPKGQGTPEQQMVLKRLEERLDSAVTRREQERISDAIRQLTSEME